MFSYVECCRLSSLIPPSPVSVLNQRNAYSSPSLCLLGTITVCCCFLFTEKPKSPVNYDSGQKTRRFYQSCMSESRQGRQQTLADFTNLIRNVSTGGTFNLAVVLERIHLLDAWPLFTVTVGPNEKSAQDVNVARVTTLSLSL